MYPYYAPPKKSQIEVEVNKRFKEWAQKVSDKSLADLFLFESFDVVNGVPSVKSSCGRYRLVFYPNKTRLVDRGKDAN